MKTNNRWILGLILIILFVAGWLFLDSKKEPESKEVAGVSDQNEKLTYQINADSVVFNLGNKQNFTLTGDQYPKLFKSNGKTDEKVEVKPFDLNGDTFYLVSNTHFYRDLTTYDYILIVEPEKKKVMYETNDIFGKYLFDGYTTEGYSYPLILENNAGLELVTKYKPVYQDGGGLTDGYFLLDFLNYDKDKNEFVFENTKHKEDISKALETIKNTGRINPLTEKEYSIILGTYENILEGKEQSVFINMKGE